MKSVSNEHIQNYADFGGYSAKLIYILNVFKLGMLKNIIIGNVWH